MNFWNILRVLTTNECNYNCVYCHNEGQARGRGNGIKLQLKEFIRFMESLQKYQFKEIRFSGGEPLVNEETIKMIEWAARNTSHEIGLATNGSLMTDDIARRLYAANVMTTVHFPGVNNRDYNNVTNSDVENFFRCCRLLDANHVDYSFNYVLYPKTSSNIDSVIQYAVEKRKRIKLLPYIDDTKESFSKTLIEEVSVRLDAMDCKKKVYDNSGITLWVWETGGTVKLIESPCYTSDIDKCRDYGEIRLLPDLSLQHCILGNNYKLKNDDNIEVILKDMWDKFTFCDRRC